MISAALVGTALAAPKNHSYHVKVTNWRVDGLLINQSNSVMTVGSRGLLISSTPLNIKNLQESMSAPYNLKLGQKQQTIVPVRSATGDGCWFVFNPIQVDNKGNGYATLTFSNINQYSSCDADDNGGLKVAIMNS